MTLGPGDSANPEPNGTDAPLAAAIEPDQAFIAAVNDAILGEVLSAEPDRALSHATDFSGFYIRHRSSLALSARRFLNDPRDVDEVVQETFLRLFLAISEIDTELQAIAFARRTLTNLCIDRYRLERRRPTLVDLDAGRVLDRSDDMFVDDPVLRAEDAAIVREALSLLSPLHREALVKREIEEKSLPQIAAELDVPEESVKHLLFRARRSLRKLLVGTTVEPGVDLTAAEVLGIANRRAARAAMQSANVLILFVIGAVITAVGLTPFVGTGHQRTLINESAGTPITSGRAAVPAIPLGTALRHAASGASRTHSSRSSGPSSSSGTPAIGGSHTAAVPHVSTDPVGTHHPAGGNDPDPGGTGPGPGGGTSSNAPKFSLSGPLDVKGSPSTQQVGTTAGPNDTQTSVSQFSAPTSEGTFTLAQSVTDSASGATTVSIAPAFQIGNTVVPTLVVGSDTQVTTQPDGSVSVDVTATGQPNFSTNLFQVSYLHAHFVLSPDFDHVLSESVAVQQAVPPAAPTAAPSSSAARCQADAQGACEAGDGGA